MNVYVLMNDGQVMWDYGFFFNEAIAGETAMWAEEKEELKIMVSDLHRNLNDEASFKI